MVSRAIGALVRLCEIHMDHTELDTYMHAKAETGTFAHVIGDPKRPPYLTNLQCEPADCFSLKPSIFVSNRRFLESVIRPLATCLFSIIKARKCHYDTTETDACLTL
jgi:hypothetical protein